MKRGSSDKTFHDVAGIYGLTLIGVLLLWYTPLGYPIRLFATLTHELGHVAATVFTGGTLHRITVSANTSGAVYQEGGMDWLISPAGYLATVVAGVALMIACAHERRQRAGLSLVCLTLIGYAGASATSMWVVIGLGSLLGWILVLLIMNWELLRGGTIRILALSLSVHSILDLVTLLIGYKSQRTVPLWQSPVLKPDPGGFYTDATLMAWRYGGSEGMWASIWLAIGIIVMIVGIVVAVNAELSDDQAGREAKVPERLRSFKKGEGEYTLN